MLVQVLAGTALLLVLFSVFRFAMGLRAAKLAREEGRNEQRSLGRDVVAELPLDDQVVLFLEGSDGFYWGADEARKSDLRGARVLMNGAAVEAARRKGSELPPHAAPPPEEFDGRERWHVRLYLAGGAERDVPCGRLREGVSREAALQVFGAVRRSLSASDPL